MIFIGIDPGISGGIAVFDDREGDPMAKRDRIVKAFKMPKDTEIFVDILNCFELRSCFATVEKVWTYPPFDKNVR